MDNTEILLRALTAYNSRMPQYTASVEAVDGISFFSVLGKSFRCIVEPVLTAGLLSEHAPDVLYVTVNAAPRLLDYAAAHGVNILDCAGNFRLQTAPDDAPQYFILANKGEKPVGDFMRTAYPVFREAGLKVVFYLLLERDNVNRSFRAIQAATGVSIGTVKNVMDGLLGQQFVRMEGGRRFLINIDRLLMLWSVNYAQNLKPSLFVTRMRFRNDGVRPDRTAIDIDLPCGMMWGGEAAAALSDSYLTPGEFTIYTDVPAAMLMKTGAVKPSDDGIIAVYRKFWLGDASLKTVPPVLTYADLMDFGNSRCIEAAQRMRQNELAYLF